MVRNVGRSTLAALVVAIWALSSACTREPGPTRTARRTSLAPTVGERRSAGPSPRDALLEAPIPLEGFEDGARHFRNATGEITYARFDPSQVREIADNILLFQRNNGGWPANWDPARVLSPVEAAQAVSGRGATDTTFDNRATYPAVEYLAEAYRRTGASEHIAAAIRGIEFILAAQYPSGGWPHSYPDVAGYRGHITFMDDVMPGVLTTLRKVASGNPPFDGLDSRLVERVADAVVRGDRCILDLQVVVRGERTVWAGQYDRETLAPTCGRSYELVSLVSRESAAVVRYLMDIDAPSQEVIDAVEAAVRWFEDSRIVGFRIEEFATNPVRFNYHTSTTDRRLVEDPLAPAHWARFYEIDTNRPIMANRDGTKVYSLAEVHRERRTGYDWYGEFGSELLQRDYPEWLQRRGAVGTSP